MATRIKTVRYAFPTYTLTAASATNTNLTQITVELPEAPTGGAFKSAYLEISYVTANSNVAVTTQTWALQLGAVAYSSTQSSGGANFGATAEDTAIISKGLDFTSYFVTNWTGTSMTLNCRFNVTVTGGLEAVTAVMVITYSYDDTAATQLKTVAIPFESRNSALPTTATNFGTSQIPQLTGVGGFLPENTPVIKDWYIIIEGNSGAPDTTDYTVSARVDALTTLTFVQLEAGSLTGTYMRLIFKPPNGVPDTTVSHNFQLWCDVARLHNITATLYVTYAFTLSGTTRLLNSIQLSLEMPSPMGGTTVDFKSQFIRDILITEPGTITLRQSGVRLLFNTPATPTVSFSVGAQAFRNYAVNGTVSAGMQAFQQRIDSGSAQGAGITLARGLNDINVRAYSNNISTGVVTNVSGIIFLNYESDVPTAGIGAANSTYSLVQFVRNSGITSTSFPTPDFSFAGNQLPTNWWLTDISYQINFSAGTTLGGISFILFRKTGDAITEGSEVSYADVSVGDPELGSYEIFCRARGIFKRYPNDQDTSRLNPTVTFRPFSIMVTGACHNMFIICNITTHEMTFTASGNISGNNAALPTTVKLVRAVDNMLYDEQVLSAGTTAFSFTVHDDALDYYVDAYQDETHVGRSGLAKAA